MLSLSRLVTVNLSTEVPLLVSLLPLWLREKLGDVTAADQETVALALSSTDT